MKAAQVSDIWRRLFKRPFDVSYESLSFTGVRRIGAATVSFKPGITAFVGGNGVGKSTLMSTIVRSLGSVEKAHAAALFDSPDFNIAGRLRVKPGGQLITTSIEGGEVRVEPAEATLPSHQWVDPSTYATRVQEKILGDAAFSENLEGIDAERYSEQECSIMSYIVGKNYDSIEAYEIEYAELETMPYFRVKADGIDYDSAQMGLGELSLFLIYWQMRAVERDTIVLIEEPETHVSPKSQQNLINVCANICLQKGLHLIITTHSPFVVWKLPREYIALLVRDGENIRVISSPTHDQIARVLGDRLNYHGTLLVEDDVGRAVLRGILRGLAPELLEYYEIAIADSTDGISHCINRMPELKKWFSMVGVFDGDQREALEKTNSRWPQVFLPGTQAPEELLKHTIEGQLTSCAASLGCSIEQLNIAREAAEGQEVHDWLRQVRQALSIDLNPFVDSIIRVWLSSGENKALCEELIAKLQDKAFLIAKLD